MKKFIIALLAAVLATGAIAQHSFPDVPENHWAGEAVDRAADLNIVIGFPDGTFRGNEAFTRYQAALVVSRLLDVIGTNVNAALALTNADLDALRSAVQEIASDVAAQDARLGAAESAVVGLSDDVAANSSRLDAIEAAIGSGDVDPAVLRDLQNQIAAQRVAVDNAFDVGTRALARANQNASEIAALNRLAGLINDDVKALQAWSYTVDPSGTPVAPAPGANAAEVEALGTELASIRDFAILIRKSQVESDRRITALEEKVDGWDFDSLEARVAELENNMFGVSGNITVNYYVGRLSGPAFDHDRAYGADFYYPSQDAFGANRRAFNGFSAFSAGDLINPQNGRVVTYAEDRTDIYAQPGSAVATLTLNFGSRGLSLDGVSHPRELNEHSAVFGGSVVVTTAGSAANVLQFRVDKFTTTFKPIGAAPLVFEFGTNVNAAFTPYVVWTNESGLVATVSGVEALSFIDPTITAFYTASADNYRTGVRVGINAFDGVEIGAHYVREGQNGSNWDVVDNDQYSAFGVDASVSVSFVNIAAEYAHGSYLVSGSTAATTSNAMYVTAGIGADAVDFINVLEVNYRNIKEDWFDGYNVGARETHAPFVSDQAGFGVKAGFGFDFGGFGIGAAAYFDTYSDSPVAPATATFNATAFGVDVTLTPFANLDLTGWFHSASVTPANGSASAVDNFRGALDNTGTAVVTGGVERDNNYDNSFGVRLSHDGSNDGALVAGLNFGAEYTQFRADFDRMGLSVYADYDLSLGFVNLNPYAQFYMNTGSNDARRQATTDDTGFAFGTGITTEAFDFYTKPNFFAAVNYRSNASVAYDVNGDADGGVTSNTFQYSVGLKFNEFILDNSELTLRYGSWTTNTSTVASGSTTAVDTSDHVSGWEASWYYYDLTMDYGVYTEADENGNVSSAQAFKVAYRVNF